MWALFRRWVAREGRGAALHEALLLLHEAHTWRHPHVQESLIYREHFLGAEFTSLVLYDEVGRGTPEGWHARAPLEALAALQAKYSTPWLDVEIIGTSMANPQAGAHGVVGLLTCQPALAAEFAGRLKGLTAELVERLRPARMLVGEVVDTPGRFFVLGDSNSSIDLDRYLKSSLHQHHVAALGPLLAAPTRWFALELVWRHARPQSATARDRDALAGS